MQRLVQLTVLALLLASGSPAAATVPAAQAMLHKPRVPAAAPLGSRHAGWASSNWSGYAISASTYTTISGSWVVQSAAPSGKPTYSSQWIGIDGFNNSSLIQTGTESDYVNGSARYRAWWEILPAAETLISTISVQPGDHMSATITKGSGSSWTISISDSRGQSFSTVQTYTGPQSSAEWIEEAPTVGGHIATLANYGLATFDPGTANSKNPGLTAADSGIMVQHHRQVSTPSNPDSDTDGFNMQYGSSVPAPPRS